MNLSQAYQELARASIGRILVMDGPLGAVLDSESLTEADFRGEMLQDHSVDLEGDGEILNITAPERIKTVHRAYLEAGSDIIRTNTMKADALSQEKYRLENMAYDLACAGARVARTAIDEYNEDILQCKAGKLGQTLERKYVAGTLGPVDSPEEIGFHELVAVYSDVARGLLDGGADILLFDGARDSRSLKASLYAMNKVCNDRSEIVPIMVMGEISRSGGCLQSGQTARALLHSVSSYPVFSIGLTAGEAEEDVFPHLKDVSTAPMRMCTIIDVPLEGVNLHDVDSVKSCARSVWRYTDAGLLNFVGGGKSSTPDTIRFLVKALKGCRPRRTPARRYSMALSGLEPLLVPQSACLCVGNVFNRNESPAFARLLQEGNLKEALALGRRQGMYGARVLDVNLGEGEVEPAQVSAFMRAMGEEETLAKLPVMVESSRWDLLAVGMESVPGKGIARSISLSEGEEVFLAKAQEIRKRGFALVCYAEDENGAAETFERETQIAERMYRLLVGKLNFLAEDIVFEPCVESAAGTPLPDSVNLLFKVCRFVKANLPYAHVLGDIKKLGLYAEGMEKAWPGLTSVFLHQAKKCGLDFYVATPGKVPAYEELPYRLCCILEDAVKSPAGDSVKKLKAAIANG